MHLSSTLCVVRRLGRGKKESVWGMGMMERGKRRQASAVFFVYIYQEHLPSSSLRKKFSAFFDTLYGRGSRLFSLPSSTACLPFFNDLLFLINYWNTQQEGASAQERECAHKTTVDRTITYGLL